MVNLSCSNSLLHAAHAVKGGASTVIDSTEVTCCAECQLPCINVEESRECVYVCYKPECFLVLYR